MRRDWRALLATVLVVAALVAWLQAFDGFYIWFAGVESGLLLAAVCLPLTALALSAGQRIAGIAAVTVFGAWLVAMDLCTRSPWTPSCNDARSTGTALVCTLASVGACFLAQALPPLTEPAAEVGTTPVASRACRCAPAPCSDPDRPIPTPRPPSRSGQPLLGHLDPCSSAILDETCERLRQVFGTTNRRTLPLSATGSAGMEAAFVNTVGPGDVVVVAVNGLFGQRMSRWRSRCGAEVVAVEPSGAAGRRRAGARRPPAPKLIAAVHAETSTGVLSDLEPLGRRQGRRAAAGRLRHLARRRPGARWTTGASTSPTRARRSAWASRRAWRRSRSTTAPGSGGSRSRRAGTSTSGCSAATPGRPAGSGRPHLPPHRARRHGRLAARRARPDPRGGADAVHARHAEAGRLLQEGLRRWGWSCSPPRATGCRS